MEARSLLITGLVLSLACVGTAAAGDDHANANATASPPSYPTPVVNVHVGPQESSGAGWAGIDPTLLIVLVVLGVLVIALVVGLAGRDRYW